MKKKTKMILGVLVILIFIIVLVKNIPYGKSSYQMPNSDIKLEVPKFSIFEEECCMFSASFKSFRSKFLLEIELEKIMREYEEITCNNETVYYDKKSDITIQEWGVKRGLLLNQLYITYNKGRPTNFECSVVTDPLKTTYQIDKRLKTERDICYIPEKFQYYDEAGDINDVHYQCIGDILFQSGMGKMHYLNDLLSHGWISMQNVIDYLEYQTIHGMTKKETFKNDGTVIYRNQDFSLLRCNRSRHYNQDIYIGDDTLTYDKTKMCANFGVEVN